MLLLAPERSEGSRRSRRRSGREQQAAPSTTATDATTTAAAATAASTTDLVLSTSTTPPGGTSSPTVPPPVPPLPPPPISPPTASCLLEICKLPSMTNQERQKQQNHEQQQQQQQEERQQRKQDRLDTFQSWQTFYPDELSKLLRRTTSRENCGCFDPKNGCLPLHWAAGTGFDEMIILILDLMLLLENENENEKDENDRNKDNSSSSSSISSEKNEEEEGDDAVTVTTTPLLVVPAVPAVAVVLVDQIRAFYPSTNRTPLHYAARNGHLSTCRLLMERYGASPHPKCGRGSVTPLQLAVWQNWLPVVQYLWNCTTTTASTTSTANVAATATAVGLERNDFDCGLQHWIGLVPKNRWCGHRRHGATTTTTKTQTHDNEDDNEDDNDSEEEEEEEEDGEEDGSGVLPLARYLHDIVGISYASTPENCNAQGHTPLHKAAWGGNLALIQYYFSCSVSAHHQYQHQHQARLYDNVQDAAGNFAADIAQMRGNHKVARWLLEHGSIDRYESFRILGLEHQHADGATTTNNDEEIKIIKMIRQRYKDLARKYHPDKREQQQQQQQQQQQVHAVAADDNDNTDTTEDFVKIQQAYDHLIKEGGIGKQKNPKYDMVKNKLLLMEQEKEQRQHAKGKHKHKHKHKQADGGISLEEHDDNNDHADDDDHDHDLLLFVPRLLAVLSDYGEQDKGFPVSLIPRRWNQIWGPDHPFPSPEEYLIEKKKKQWNINGSSSNADADNDNDDNHGHDHERRNTISSCWITTTQKVKLLPFLKWKCRGSQVRFRHGVGGGAHVVAYVVAAAPAAAAKQPPSSQPYSTTTTTTTTTTTPTMMTASTTESTTGTDDETK